MFKIQGLNLNFQNNILTQKKFNSKVSKSKKIILRSSSKTNQDLTPILAKFSKNDFKVLLEHIRFGLNLIETPPKGKLTSISNVQLFWNALGAEQKKSLKGLNKLILENLKNTCDQFMFEKGRADDFLKAEVAKEISSIVGNLSLLKAKEFFTIYDKGFGSDFEIIPSKKIPTETIGEINSFIGTAMPRKMSLEIDELTGLLSFPDKQDYSYLQRKKYEFIKQCKEKLLANENALQILHQANLIDIDSNRIQRSSQDLATGHIDFAPEEIPEPKQSFASPREAISEYTKDLTKDEKEKLFQHVVDFMILGSVQFNERNRNNSQVIDFNRDIALPFIESVCDKTGTSNLILLNLPLRWISETEEIPIPPASSSSQEENIWSATHQLAKELIASAKELDITPQITLNKDQELKDRVLTINGYLGTLKERFSYDYVQLANQLPRLSEEESSMLKGSLEYTEKVIKKVAYETLFFRVRYGLSVHRKVLLTNITLTEKNHEAARTIYNLLERADFSFLNNSLEHPETFGTIGKMLLNYLQYTQEKLIEQIDDQKVKEELRSLIGIVQNKGFAKSTSSIRKKNNI